jgi:hypothetical protein
MVIVATLTACGSRPVPEPATLTAARSDMRKAMAAYADNRYAEARNFFGRALANYKSVDDLGGQAETLVDLADSALLQGDVTAARSYLLNAHGLVQGAALGALEPRLSLLDAYADLQAGDAAGAAAALDALLKTPALPADIRQAALFARTQAAFDLKAADSAGWLAQLTAAGADKDALGKARLDRLKALAAADASHAAALYAEALPLYQAAYYRPGIAATHEEWADLLLAQQDWNGARDHLRRALDVRLWMYDATHAARDLEKLGKADGALGDSAAASKDAQWAAYLKNGGDPSQSPIK